MKALRGADRDARGDRGVSVALSLARLYMLILASSRARQAAIICLEAGLRVRYVATSRFLPLDHESNYESKC